MLKVKFAAATLLLLLIFNFNAHACPFKKGLTDFNCDGKFVISFFGDSITRGHTDSLFNGVSGGVPLRLEKRLTGLIPHRFFSVLNFGTPGFTCQQVKAQLRHELGKNTDDVAKSDVVIIGCGVNDFAARFSKNQVRSYLLSMRRITERRGMFTVIASLTNASATAKIQGLQDWNNALNQTIADIGQYLPYNQIDPTSMLVSDGIHPNRKGFDLMFKIFKSFLFGATFTSLAEQQLGLIDSDQDGIYDTYETRKFHTDPLNADSDGDGLNDLQELFTYRTNPLLADSDGDNISDGDEVANGTNPRVPN